MRWMARLYEPSVRKLKMLPLWDCEQKTIRQLRQTSYLTFFYTYVCCDLSLSKRTIICDQYSDRVNRYIGKDWHWSTRLFDCHRWHVTFELFMPVKNLSAIFHLVPVMFHTSLNNILLVGFVTKIKTKPFHTVLSWNWYRLLRSTFFWTSNSFKWLMLCSVLFTVWFLCTYISSFSPLFCTLTLTSHG